MRTEQTLARRRLAPEQLQTTAFEAHATFYVFLYWDDSNRDIAL